MERRFSARRAVNDAQAALIMGALVERLTDKGCPPEMAFGFVAGAGAALGTPSGPFVERVECAVDRYIAKMGSKTK